MRCVNYYLCCLLEVVSWVRVLVFGVRCFIGIVLLMGCRLVMLLRNSEVVLSL